MAEKFPGRCGARGLYRGRVNKAGSETRCCTVFGPQSCILSLFEQRAVLLSTDKFGAGSPQQADTAAASFQTQKLDA